MAAWYCRMTQRQERLFNGGAGQTKDGSRGNYFARQKKKKGISSFCSPQIAAAAAGTVVVVVAGGAGGAGGVGGVGGAGGGAGDMIVRNVQLEKEVL